MSKKLTVPLVSGLVAGVAASLCCTGPLVLLLLGFTGAWVSNLTALEPYRPIFITISIVALIMAYLQLYKPTVNQECEEGKVCAKSPVKKKYKILFLGIFAIVVISIASPYLIAMMYR
jgi:mercuric ion transport protein